MSRAIRKTRRSCHKSGINAIVNPDHQVHGLFMFKSFTKDGENLDCVISPSSKEARSAICELAYGCQYEKLTPDRKKEIDELRWETTDPRRVLFFNLSRMPGWEPQSEEESEEPPNVEDRVGTIIRDYGECIVYAMQ